MTSTALCWIRWVGLGCMGMLGTTLAITLVNGRQNPRRRRSKNLPRTLYSFRRKNRHGFSDVDRPGFFVVDFSLTSTRVVPIFLDVRPVPSTTKKGRVFSHHCYCRWIVMLLSS